MEHSYPVITDLLGFRFEPGQTLAGLHLDSVEDAESSILSTLYNLKSLWDEISSFQESVIAEQRINSLSVNLILLLV